MNGWNYVTGKCNAINKLDMQHILYAYLLSDITCDGEYIYHPVKVSRLHETFKFNRKAIDEALEVLIANAYVVVVDGYACLGPAPEGMRYTFYADLITNEIDSEKKLINSWCRRYMESCARIGKQSQAKQCSVHIKALFVRGLGEWTSRDFVDFYNYMYELTFEATRFSLGKELGQMKSLLKVHDPASVFKMILCYFQNIGEYTTQEPNIGHLLVIREKVFLRVKGKSVRFKSKEKLRERKEGERARF